MFESVFWGLAGLCFIYEIVSQYKQNKERDKLIKSQENKFLKFMLLSNDSAIESMRKPLMYTMGILVTIMAILSLYITFQTEGTATDAGILLAATVAFYIMCAARVRKEQGRQAELAKLAEEISKMMGAEQHFSEAASEIVKIVEADATSGEKEGEKQNERA